MLLAPDGRPVPGVELTVASVGSRHVVLHCNRPLAVIPELAYFEATIPPPRDAEPEERHGDGSIGDDDGARLEA